MQKIIEGSIPCMDWATKVPDISYSIETIIHTFNIVLRIDCIRSEYPSLLDIIP